MARNERSSVLVKEPQRSRVNCYEYVYEQKLPKEFNVSALVKHSASLKGQWAIVSAKNDEQKRE